MGLSGCYALMKYLVIIVNLIFWIIGIATVALAIWMFFDPTFYVSMTQDSNNYFISTCILFVAGVLLVVVAFLGCCGSFKESQCMLITFFSLLLVILVAQIAAGIWAYVNAESLEKLVRSSVKNTVQKEYYDEVGSRKATFDAFQKGLKCCGADKPSDWIRSEKLFLGVSADAIEYKIPESCCREEIDAKTCAEKTSNVKVGVDMSRIIYQEGCYQKIIEAIRENANIIFGVGLAIVIMEVIGLIFALILAFAINKNRRYKA